MVSEAVSGLAALKTAFDLAKGLKELSDATNRNAAIIELQERILAAQTAHASLLDQVAGLEKELALFKKWDAEQSRYKLTDYGNGTFAYELRLEASAGEPPHRLCPTCFHASKKSILQFRGKCGYSEGMYRCDACQSDLFLGRRVESDTVRFGRTRVASDWDPYIAV